MIRPLQRQRGAALILLLAIVVLSGMWYLVSRVNARTGDFTAANRLHNARVLAEAKRALLGYVAHQAAVSGENNPGAFLCPEPAGNIGSATLEGQTTGNCSLPAVGRLPWKTIGIEKLLDASGEPLWYVVANGWAKPNSSTNTVINSNCTDAASAMTCWSGQLTVDGQANAAVALIIAPGPAMSAQASPGCTARNQSRTAPSPSINPLDYLECYSTASSTFITNGPSSSFNDQVVKITAAEILPLIEGAVADRFQKEFAAQIKAAYTTNPWSAGTLLPFAAPFANPTTVPTTSTPAAGSNFRGAAATFQGLLPLTYAFTKACSPAPCLPTPCTVGTDALCDPGFVNWQGATITRLSGANLGSYSCVPSGGPSALTCTVYTYDVLGDTAMNFTFSLTATNVGMSLRQINATVQIGGLDTATAQTQNPTPTSGGVNPQYGYCASYSTSATCAGTPSTLNADGSATINLIARTWAGTGISIGISGALCGLDSQTQGLLCYQHTVTVPMAVLSDHPLVDPSNTSYNWFARNRWQELSYYALAAGVAPSGAGSCTTGGSCLQVNYSPDAGKHRALLILGGQKLSTLDALGNPYTQVRPATAVKDLLDDRNAAGASPFELRSPTLAVNRAFNDHFAVIDKNP